jgi:adenine phosphoribosyltransferase
VKEYLKLIDTNTPGPRYDVTPLFADPLALSALCDDLVRPFEGQPIDYVMGIDALGFILGTAIAVRLNRGFIPLRKSGKLPVPTIGRWFVDYTGQTKALELRRDAIQPGSRVLIVDEWVETGAQMQAAVELVEQVGGIVIGIAAIQMDECPASVELRKKYKCSFVWPEQSGDERPGEPPVSTERRKEDFGCPGC